MKDSKLSLAPRPFRFLYIIDPGVILLQEHSLPKCFMRGSTEAGITRFAVQTISTGIFTCSLRANSR